MLQILQYVKRLNCEVIVQYGAKGFTASKLSAWIKVKAQELGRDDIIGRSWVGLKFKNT